jgi:excinuclease ABC subunit C
MVVFEDALPLKNAYRKFSIPEYVDDTEAIHQVLSRRLARLEEDDPSKGSGTDFDVPVVTQKRKRFAYRPGLIIVDGGQPQVEAAQRALDDAGVSDIPVCGLAKRLEEIWLPGEEFPVILPRNSEALFLFQRIRDEAHRFAITFQRQKRRTDIASQLSEIPGLGPARVKVLLRHFGSVKRLRAAAPAEIAEVRGIGPTLAETIVARLGSSTSPVDSSPDHHDQEQRADA